jgi:hypothetical protein
MDNNSPLHRLHQLVPPLEVTATAGVGWGLFAFGRMIFRAPFVLTVLGGLGVLAFGAFHDGMSGIELWRLACGLVIMVAVIFMIGFFSTRQPLPALALLAFLVLTNTPNVPLTIDHTVVVDPPPVIPLPVSSSHWWVYLMIAVGIFGVWLSLRLLDRVSS